MASAETGKLQSFSSERLIGFVHVAGHPESVFIHGNTLRKVTKTPEGYQFERYEDNKDRRETLTSLKPPAEIVVLNIRATRKGLRAKKWGLVPT